DIPAYFVRRGPQWIDGAIGLYARSAFPAEQLGNRFAFNLAFDVPKCDVDSRNRVNDAAPTAYIARTVVHALPQPRDIGRIAANDALLQPHRSGVRRGGLDNRPYDLWHAIHLG